MLYVFNWHTIAGGGDYSCGDRGPVRRWSTPGRSAIEEQFYILWPLLLVLLLRWPRSRRHLLALCIAGATLSVVALTVLARSGGRRARAYYGTDTRAFGLLIGAVLGSGLVGACCATWGQTLDLGVPRPGRLGARCEFLVAWAWINVDSEGELYPGVMPAVSLAVGDRFSPTIALVPDGVAARALSVRPLPALGRISYGVYLWHWPIFLVLSSERSRPDRVVAVPGWCS